MTAKLHEFMSSLHFVDIWRELHPASKVYSCYTPTNGAHSRLDRFLLANIGALDVRRVAYQVRFLSGHEPLLLECETHTPRPVIPLWKMRPELLRDPEYKGDIQAARDGYFSVNWYTIRTCGIEWEALKVVTRCKSIGISYGIRKKKEWELTQQEDMLTALRSRVASVDASETDCRETHTKIGAIWNRLDSYKSKDYRQRLYCSGDRSGACRPGSLSANGLYQ
ncbi:hypothetical protein NDU88_005705 [Pleurodeles waltl]|uniref:Uncharacterized protein n=1 Tax=Pleurodeles waltl TaxID=8319 RepID=A0AAV7TCD2_PLEWA|nr:hypothetical protein NDU88_005705 [Pleurodeles waltl]